MVWQARMPRQPIAWMAEFAMATPSAPSAIALTKSDSVRRPPVMMKRDVTAHPARVQMAAGADQGGDGGHRDVALEDFGGRAGGAAAPVEDDVVDPDFEREIDVVFDVLGRHLLAGTDLV